MENTNVRGAHVAVTDSDLIAVDDHGGAHAHVQPESFYDYVVGPHDDVGQCFGEHVSGGGYMEAGIRRVAGLFG